jgi:hypothetical protein
MEPVKVAATRPAPANRRTALTRPSAPRRSANHLEVPMDSASVKQTAGPEPAVRDGVLVNGAWLEAHLHDPAVRVVEVDVSRRAYDDWHVGGAVLWNVYTDLKNTDYQLAGNGALERLFTRSGIRPDTTVVCYGYAPAMAFWLMKLCGHADVRILDCSRDAWQRDSLRAAARRPRPPSPAIPSAARMPGCGPTTSPCGTPSLIRAPPSLMCGARPSTAVSGSGPPAAWNQAVAPGTSPQQSTSPSTACTTTGVPSGPPPSSVESSPEPVRAIPAG